MLFPLIVFPVFTLDMHLHVNWRSFIVLLFVCVYVWTDAMKGIYNAISVCLPAACECFCGTVDWNIHQTFIIFFFKSMSTSFVLFSSTTAHDMHYSSIHHFIVQIDTMQSIRARYRRMNKHFHFLFLTVYCSDKSKLTIRVKFCRHQVPFERLK